MGAGIPAKIIHVLDWDKSKDLGDHELQPLIDAMNEIESLKGKVSNAQILIREALSLSKKQAKEGERQDKIDVEALKNWFEAKKLDKSAQEELLKSLQAANPYRLGQMLDIKDGRHWRTAGVIEVSGFKIRIHFEGWAEKYDEDIHIKREADRIAPYLSETKGRWTGESKVCPYFGFDAEDEEFVKAKAIFEEFYTKFAIEPAELKGKFQDVDVEYLLGGDGARLALNMIKAKCAEEKRDGLIPAAILKKYMKLLGIVLMSGVLEEQKKYPKAPSLLLDRVLQVFGCDENAMMYYYKNPISGIAEDPEDGKFARKKKGVSQCVVNLVNQFGADGGFTTLKERVKSVADNKKGTPLKYSFASLSKVIKLVAKCKPILRREFLDNFIRQLDLTNLVQPALNSLDENGIRGLATSDITNLGEDIKSLLIGLEKTAKVNRFVEETNLEVIKILLKVDQLPKKMDALKKISQIIRALEEKKRPRGYFSFQWPSTRPSPAQRAQRAAVQAAAAELPKLQFINQAYFLKWLETEKVVETVLRPDSHEMIISMSVPILKYFAANGKLGPHLKTLSNLLDADMETAKVVSRAIADVAEKLPEKELKVMFSTFADKMLDDYTVADLKLIADFTKSAIKSSGGKGNMYGLDIFWNMLQEDNQKVLAPEVAKEAIRCIRNLFASEIIKDNSVYIKRCVSNLEKHESVVNSLDLLKLLLECSDHKATSKSIVAAETTHKLLKKFFKDYLDYNQQAAKEMDTLEEEFTNETVLVGLYPHEAQVSSRLAFLKFLIQNSTLALTNENVDSLWTVCVTDSVTPRDISLFMAWLSDCMLGKADKLSKSSAGPKKTRKEPEERKIYDAFDAKSSSSMFSKLEKQYTHSRTNKPINVTPEWYSCFANTFVNTNKGTGALSSEGYVVDYTKMEGKSALWNFALREADGVVRTQAQRFLVAAHTKLDIKMKEDGKAEVLKEFLSKCVQELTASGKDSKNQNAIVDDSVMTVLRQLVRSCETGEMVKRPLWKVGEKVRAAWKKPATQGVTLYQATVTKVNSGGGLSGATAVGAASGGEPEVTYALHYIDDDKDPAAKESYIRMLDGKVKERPPLVLSEVELYPSRFLSGAVKEGKEFFSLAMRVLENGGDAGRKAWDLLKMLPPNVQAMENIRKIPYATENDLKNFLPSNPIKLLYAMTVVDPSKAFLLPTEGATPNPLTSTTWCMDFVKKGALGELVGVLSSFDKKQILAQSLPSLCLTKMLSFISFFLVSNEGQVGVPVEDIIAVVDLKNLIKLCLEYLELAVKGSNSSVVSVVLQTTIIATRLQPELINELPKAAPWSDIFSSALMENKSVDVQVAFTKGIIEVCEHSTGLPVIALKPKQEDTKEPGEESDKGEGGEKPEGENQNGNGKTEEANKAEKKVDKAAEKLEFHLDVHRLFTVLDKDKNKLLDAKELNSLFKGGRPFPPGVADGVYELIEAADTAGNGKISFQELSVYFQKKNLTSTDLEITYGKLNDIKRENDAKRANAPKLRQEMRSAFLPILLARFVKLDTSQPCASFLTLMGELIRQTESIEEKEAIKIAKSLAELIKNHPMRERSEKDEDQVLGAFMRLTAETIRKAPFLKKMLGAKGEGKMSLLGHTVDSLFAIPAAKREEAKESKEAKEDPVALPKCKHKNSKAAAFQLLLSLAEGNDENLAMIVELLGPNHALTHSDGKRKEVWDYEPPRDISERGSGYVGLHNCGNTCFINAALQQLFMMPKLRKTLLKVDGYDVSKKQLLFGFQHLMSHLQETAARAITPRKFLESYIDPSTGKPVRAPGVPPRQDDSFAFMQSLLGKLEDETKGSPYNKSVENLMGIGECTEMIGTSDSPYLSDHTKKHRNRIATSIGVNVKGCNTLEQCLQNYVKGEQISGYSGASDPGIFGQTYPGKKINILKRTSFKTLPNTLTIGLNRMEFTWDNSIQNMVGRKLVHRVAFPFELDMKPYCFEYQTTPKGYNTGDPEETPPAAGEEGKESKSPIKSPLKSPAAKSRGRSKSPSRSRSPAPGERRRANRAKVERRQKALGLKPRKESYYKYRLMGVIVHSGQTLNSGHYYSFIRERPKGPEDPPPGEKGNRWFCFNDSSVTLFDYRKLGDETFGATDGSWKSATAYVLVYERAEPEPDVKLETKEVPTELLERIWHDNRVRVRDANVYNEPYFQFLCELLSLVQERFPKPTQACAETKPSELKGQALDLCDASSRLFTRFLLITLARSARRQYYWHRFTDGVAALLSKNVATSTWLFSKLLHPTDDWMTDLLNAPYTGIRESVTRLFAAAARSVSPLEQKVYELPPSKEDTLTGEGEILVPTRGYVAQTVDKLLSLLDSKESGSLVMESLADFASIGEVEAKYLQRADILKYMLSGITGESSSHHLADSVFTLLCTLRKDLKSVHVDTLLSPSFLSRLIREPYTYKRAGPIVKLIKDICTEEMSGGDKEEAWKRLETVLSAILQGFQVLNFEKTRPYFRILAGLVDKDVEDRKQVAAVVDTLIQGIVGALSVNLYRRTDFMAEHLLRLAQSSKSFGEVMAGVNTTVIKDLIEFFNTYPDYPSTIRKIEVMKNRDKERLHTIATRAKKPAGFGITYTLFSKFSDYGRSTKDKLQLLNEIDKGNSILNEEKSAYDSDEERHRTRTPDKFKVGMRLDVLDTARKWLISEICAIKGNLVKITYIGHSHHWDEWLEMGSPRICLQAESLSRLEKQFSSRR